MTHKHLCFLLFLLFVPNVLSCPMDNTNNFKHVLHNSKADTWFLLDFMEEIAASAYCSETEESLNNLKNWNCTHCYSHVNVTATLDVAKDKNKPEESDLFVFVGYSVELKGIIISFRGTTQKISDWIYNLNAQHSKTSFLPSDLNIEVHSGFLKAYLKLKEKLFESVKEVRDLGCGTKSPLYITGHSLGAALATIAAADFYSEQGGIPPILYTYGSPRVGNTEFFDFMKNIPNKVRATNQREVVPHLPPMMLNFHHINTEYHHFNSTEEKLWFKCDGSGEDPACADSHFFNTSIEEHLHYPSGNRFHPSGIQFGDCYS